MRYSELLSLLNVGSWEETPELLDLAMRNSWEETPELLDFAMSGTGDELFPELKLHAGSGEDTSTRDADWLDDE